MPTQAKVCTDVPSSWISKVILLCDGTVAIRYKRLIGWERGHPGHHIGGRPGLCLKYPGTDVTTYLELIAYAPGPGEYVRKVLYTRPYIIIPYPCPAQGCAPCCGGVAPSGLVPSTVHATFSGAVTFGVDCSPLNGETFALTYDSGSQTWIADPVTVDGLSPVKLTLSCAGDLWHFEALGYDGISPPGVSFGGDASSATCNPFHLSFRNLPIDGAPCGGTINVTVTT
jgi:hypothetical protein